MSIDVFGPAGASDGTFFYSAGGFSFSIGGVVAAFNRFDPVANTWTPLPDMPQGAAEALAVYYPPTNTIYVFGGQLSDGTNLNVTRIYDIASNTWTTGANMPDVHSFMAGGYIPATGKIYVLSGYNTGFVDSAQPNTWEYDPVTDTWTDLTGSLPFPHPAGGFAYGVINDKLYVAGGRDAANVIINDNWEFDPVALTYTAKAPEPATFQNNAPGSAAAQGLLWVYGGGNPFLGAGPTKAAPSSEASESKAALPVRLLKRLFGPTAPATAADGRFYDPVTDTWTSSPNMNELRWFPASAAIGDTLIMAAGGYNGSTSVASAETELVCGGGPTPTPTATPGGCTVTGVIDASDPTQTDRMFRDGIASTCAAPKVCPGVLGDGLPRHYDTHTFTNTTGATQCVTVDVDAMTCTGVNFIFVQAYLGSFNPADLCQNYLADIGGSPNPTGQFSFDLADGQTVVLVVNEVDPDAGCVGYSMTIGGICGGGTPTPTPTCPPGGAPGGAPGPWVAGNPYPITDVRYGFAQTATHFYVFGGVSDGTRVNNVNRMDIATGVWEPLAPMPFASEAPTCALMESTGIVYCTEGDTGGNFAAYDIASDTWTPLASPGGDHYGSASGAFNGMVFVAGGTTGIVSTVQVYDVATNTWSAGTAAPSEFLLAGYQQVGQFLYVVGGWDLTSPATNKTTTFRLDMSSAPGVWETGPTFTPQRSDFGLAYDPAANKLYALGGDVNGNGFFDSTNLVDELDLSGWPGGTWTASPPDLPLPNRQANQAGFYGAGDIWSVGGIDGATFIFLNEVWHRNNGGGCPTPTPTPTPTVTVTPTPTPTVTVTPTPTPTVTVTPTPTVTVTPTPVPPRPSPTPRPRGTPRPRPSP
jgi:cell division septation protein DedD